MGDVTPLNNPLGYISVKFHYSSALLHTLGMKARED